MHNTETNTLAVFERWTARMRTLVGYWERLLRWILALGIALIMFAVVFHVVGRYFFGKTYMGTMELVRYTMIWVALLGAAVAFGSEGHIAVNILQDRLTKRSATWLRIAGNILLGVFLVVMIIGGFEIAVRNLKQISLGLQIPMFYPYLAIPIGGISMLFYVLMNILDSLTQLLSLRG
ncbi:TRAP transporter small permease [Desulforapulum autotrophicum]|nr:TRAP transporter small permease [Desulforapulum autotrophicum]